MKILNVDSVVTLDPNLQRSVEEDLEINLRGLKIYNLLKRIVWSSVLEKSEKRPLVYLPLLRGLLREIRVELSVENYLHKAGLKEHPEELNEYYKKLDIYSEEGYNDFSKEEEHKSIQDVLNQFSLISPSTYL